MVTMALHSPQVHGMFEMPVDHLSANHVMAKHFRNNGDLSNAVVVSRTSATSGGQHFARLLDVPVAAGAKRRLTDDRVVIDSIVGDVRGKDVIVLDDEIATAGSLIELFDKLREVGVNSITAACVHGLFTGPAVERLNAQPDLKEIVCTNTVPPRVAGDLDRLTVLSVAPCSPRPSAASTASPSRRSSTPDATRPHPAGLVIPADARISASTFRWVRSPLRARDDEAGDESGTIRCRACRDRSVG